VTTSSASITATLMIRQLSVSLAHTHGVVGLYGHRWGFTDRRIESTASTALIRRWHTNSS